MSEVKKIATRDSYGNALVELGKEHKELIVLDDLKLETNKTKEMLNILNNLKVDRNILIVVDQLDDNVVLAARNLKNVLLLQADEINALDVVSSRVLIATESAIKSVEEALA